MEAVSGRDKPHSQARLATAAIGLGLVAAAVLVATSPLPAATTPPPPWWTSAEVPAVVAGAGWPWDALALLLPVGERGVRGDLLALLLVLAVAAAAGRLVDRLYRGTGRHFTQPGWGQVSYQGFDSLGCGGLPVLDSIYAQAQVPAILSVMQVPCTPFVDIVLGSAADSCAFFIGDSLITNMCAGYIWYDMHRYLEYTYTHYATQANGCNDTTEVVVDVRTEPTLFLANAFTPNEDGINDFWPVRTDIADTGFELKVYDRWGAELWSTIDPEEQWDGEAGGGQVPLGVYVYTMKTRDRRKCHPRPAGCRSLPRCRRLPEILSAG